LLVFLFVFCLFVFLLQGISSASALAAGVTKGSSAERIASHRAMLEEVSSGSHSDSDDEEGEGGSDDEMDVDATSDVSFTDSNPEEYPLDFAGVPVNSARVIKKVCRVRHLLLTTDGLFCNFIPSLLLAPSES
jgi:hypothetical protein